MKKLKLDELVVESFVTAPDVLSRGTVMAHGPSDSCDQFCPSVTCPNSINNCPTLEEEATCRGVTDCGTCYEQGTCDLQFGCGGNSLDFQIC